MHSARQGMGQPMVEESQKNDLLVQEWTSLKTLWHLYGGAVTDDDLKAELKDYFSGPKPEGGWGGLNRAEQIMGMYLDSDRLDIEYNNLLELAKSEKLESLPTFVNYQKVFFGAGGSIEQKRSAYLALLHALQSFFVESRFERELKTKVAHRLLWVGLGLVVLVVFIHAISERYGGTRIEDLKILFAAFVMGVLGAFFSRVATFESKFSTLRFVNITEEFHHKVLWVRLLYGGIGAVIFYYILRSGLITSHVVPRWCVLESNCDPRAPQGEFTPVTEWMKLLVWSFIAGFSERLVSSSLDKFGSD